MRGFVFYLLLLPAVVLIILAILRVQFARRFWQKLYIVGLCYVALILGRLVYQTWF